MTFFTQFLEDDTNPQTKRKTEIIKNEIYSTPKGYVCYICIGLNPNKIEGPLNVNHNNYFEGIRDDYWKRNYIYHPTT